MISISVVADTHGMHRGVSIPDCDVLIHCGDFCSFQQDDLQTLQDVDAWFGEVNADHVICIGGNHDFALQSGKFRFMNAAFLEDRVIEVAGLAIYGSPWCPDLPGFAYFASHEELIEHWKRIPAGLARETLYRLERSRTIKTQGRLREMLEIISRVTEWAGGKEQAMAWYRAQPLPAFGGRTAEALVKEGKAAAVRDYLDHMALGGFA